MNCKSENNGITPEEFVDKYSTEDNQQTNTDDSLSEESHLNRQKRIMVLSDRLLDKLSCAIDEISLYASKQKKRVKEVEYDKELNKPVCETNIESETVEIKNALIDTTALKQIVSTLKDIKDIQQSYNSQDKQEEDSGVIVISQIEETEESE